MKVQYISLIIVSLVLFSCRFSSNDGKKDTGKDTGKDTFYSDLGGMGRARIPLIKPYELLKVSSNEWRLELLNPELLSLSIHNVKGINVQDGIILVYSEGGTEFLNKQHQKAWFIITPTLGLERGFSEEEKFSDEVEKSKTRMKIPFYNPDSLYKRFEENRKINW